ncbi:MAG: ATP-binding protein [Nanoarchaeota archaeon]|nr:ATP-binding protein [Nanoarchaeota archaeon]MBU4452480.1 ATP-binding protein [Nanoarchaeota archaeon]MCG2723443.1 ATP-binding protein [archaeon]
MLIGEVFGSTGTKTFNFRAEKEVRKLDFVVVEGENKTWVLSQVENIESRPDGKNIAFAKAIGYREDGILKVPMTPIKSNARVYSADAGIIQDTLKLDKNGLYLGCLDANKEVPVYIDPTDLISRHVAVLAATGSGKSYTVAVILEELLEKNIPIVIIDPHGEHTSLGVANDNAEEIEKAQKFNILSKNYLVVEYSPDTNVNSGAQQISFSDKNLEASEILHLLPTKPSSSQIGVLYSAIKELKEMGKPYELKDIIKAVEDNQSASKWAVINMLEVVRGTGLFSSKPTNIRELVKAGQASIINLRGITQEIQTVVAYKIIEKLFEERKVGRVPPMFLVVEEAHNFCPEKEVRASSKIIRTVASEGRKFGFGLCVISQRPARVDKNVLSQCNTQIVLRMTNPNDLKAVSYAEGLTSGIEKEIKNLNPGTALILGREFPIFVNIRIRRTKHGGVTVNISEPVKEVTELLAFRNYEKKYIEKKFGSVHTIYYPCWRIYGEKTYLIEAVRGKVIFEDSDATKECDIELNDDHALILSEMKFNRTLQELLERTKLTEDDLVKALKELRDKGYVNEKEENEKFVYEKTEKSVFRDFAIEPATIEKDNNSETLKFEFTKEDALKRAKLLFGAVDNIEPVYYTYYLDENQKFLIDGVTGIKKETGN